MKNLILTTSFLLLYSFTTQRKIDETRKAYEIGTEDPSDPARDGFKSLSTISAPKFKTEDRLGNVLLNGRIGKKPAFFDVYSNRELEAELSIVFCLQSNKFIGCSKKGLVVCYNAPPMVEFPEYETLNEQQRRIRHVCGSSNGIVVTTEPSDKRKADRFRVDTAFGNSYVFPIPIHKCFILWLTYDDFINQYATGAAETEFKKVANVKVNAITISNDDPDMNHTAKALEFQKEWNYVARDMQGKSISMLWKEVAVWPRQVAYYTVVPFTGQGGSSCCELSARITGPHILNCYYKWVQVGEECRGKHPGHETECEFPYTIERSNTTRTSSVISSKADVSQMEDGEKFHKSNNKTDSFDDTHMEDTKINDTSVHIAKLNDSLIKDDLDLEIDGSIRGTGGYSADKFKVTIGLGVSGRFLRKDFDDSLNVDHIDASHEERYGQDTNNRHINQSKKIDELQRGVGNDIGIIRKVNNRTEISMMTHLEINETHTLRNVVKWPEAIRVGQLHHICMGHVQRLNKTEVFGNSKEFDKIGSEKKKNRGEMTDSHNNTESCDTL